ncbi:MAG: tetratricopeptide repeat protein [Gemmatimonadota bacterium]
MPDAVASLTAPLPLREHYDELRAALGAADAGERRDELKAEIIALFRAVERELTELAALKEDVKGLVQQWKALEAPDSPPAPAPVVTADAEKAAPQRGATPTRADHLNASTYLEKGWSLLSLGDHAGAEQALARALELAPDDPQGVSLLGWAQMLQAKYDDALLNFQKVLMREPQNSLARINVGYICLKKKIFGEAIEHLSKAIRLDNDRKATLYAHYYLGLLYLEREMYEDAQNFLRKALAIGPNLIEAHYELGRAVFFAGDREGAMVAWRDGARANKFSPWGKRCAELLREVENGGAPPRTS